MNEKNGSAAVIYSGAFNGIKYEAGSLKTCKYSVTGEKYE